MRASEPAAGIFRSGCPYNRFGHGPRLVVIFQGLAFENKPLSWIAAAGSLSPYRFLGRAYTGYLVTRRPGLPSGTTLADMGDDYAATIREVFEPPVDVIGSSTGASIAQHFAADHPDLVRRLVLHAGAHTLSEPAKEVQLWTARLAEQGRWREAAAVLLDFFTPPGPVHRLLVAVGSRMMALSAPADASDLMVTVRAEDAHAFRDRLGEIRAPTLVIDGEDDPFYTPQLLRETAEGIPDARLILYPGKGHGAAGRQFVQDVLAFLAAA